MNRSCKKKKKKNTQKKQSAEIKRILYDYIDRHEKAYRNNKIKSLIDFDEEFQVALNH